MNTSCSTLAAGAAIALLCWGCGGAPHPEAVAWPRELPGGFRLASSSTDPPTEAPELVRQYGVLRQHSARYQGPAALRVSAYEMAAEAGALELVQLWRPADGILFFHQGVFFVLLEAPGAESALLNRIASPVEQALAAPR